MKKFEVTLMYHTSVQIEVEAANEDEACEKAYAEAENETHNGTLLRNLQPEGMEIHEIPQKKAYLVSFAPICRVLVDADVNKDEVIERAVKKMLDNPEDYIHCYNADEVKEDTECPYDPEVE